MPNSQGPLAVPFHKFGFHTSTKPSATKPSPLGCIVCSSKTAVSKGQPCSKLVPQSRASRELMLGMVGIGPVACGCLGKVLVLDGV